MYRQQFFIIANFLMVFDTLAIVLTGYLAYSFSLEADNSGLVMAWYDFLGCVLFLMFANNYFMGKNGFYSAKRFLSTWSMVRSLFIAISLSFALLAAGAILIGIKPFPRTYLTAHFLGTVLVFTASRIALYHHLNRRARTTFNSRQILIVGA